MNPGDGDWAYIIIISMCYFLVHTQFYWITILIDNKLNMQQQQLSLRYIAHEARLYSRIFIHSLHILSSSTTHSVQFLRLFL